MAGSRRTATGHCPTWPLGSTPMRRTPLGPRRSRAPAADLARVVGEDLAVELGVLHALLLRVLAFPLRRRDVIGSWAAAEAYLQARLRALPREAFHVLFLDKRNQLIADERMGEGSV